MRIQIIVIMLLLIAGSVIAIEECQRTQSNADIPCMIISTWTGLSGNCTDYNITIYNQTPDIVQNLTWGYYEPFCNVTFNLTKTGTYHYDSEIETGAITVVADITFGGSLLFFFFIINIAIFTLPFFVRFLEDEIWNKIMGKAVWVLGLMFMALNVTMAAQLASDAGLINVSSIIFTWHWFFIRGIYISVLILMIHTFLTAIKEWGERKREKQMGGY